MNESAPASHSQTGPEEKWQPQAPAIMHGQPEDFDYIVVGAGSAGCVLASRLTEDRDTRVLLLEEIGRASCRERVYVLV